jgi:hypothetical protein
MKTPVRQSHIAGRCIGADPARMPNLDAHRRHARRQPDRHRRRSKPPGTGRRCRCSSMAAPDGLGQGVVAWDVEVNKQDDERVAGCDNLTLVAKRG